MAPMHRLDDLRSLRAKVDGKAHDLFKAKDGVASLQVTQVFRDRRANCSVGSIQTGAFVQDQDVWNLGEIRALRNNTNDITQIFTIQQDRSWTTVNISRESFETFMGTYSITPSFWKSMFTFGRKSEENEFEFPGFNCRKTRAGNSGTALDYEFSYMLRRAELNGRSEEDGESPWSIRQTAVYHKLTCDDRSSVSGSTFLLVAPSDNFRSQLKECLESSTADETETLSCWNTHRILCADSLKGWSDYMVWLQKKLKEQSNEIVLATVGNNKANLSPLTDFNINFEHRQELKIVEDQVLDLQVILPSLVDAIHGIRAACARFAAGSSTKGLDTFDLDTIVDEFEDYEKQANLLTERAKTLKANAESTAQLLSDLLSYEEAVALKVLASETKTESHFMCQMAEKSTKDAAAVKILTIITLVYLPTTIVAVRPRVIQEVRCTKAYRTSSPPSSSKSARATICTSRQTSGF